MRFRTDEAMELLSWRCLGSVICAWPVRETICELLRMLPFIVDDLLPEFASGAGAAEALLPFIVEPCIPFAPPQPIDTREFIAEFDTGPSVVRLVDMIKHPSQNPLRMLLPQIF